MYNFIQSIKQKHELFHTTYQTVSLYHSIMMNQSIQPTKHYLGSWAETGATSDIIMLGVHTWTSVIPSFKIKNAR
jgi:hypothetical protein